MTGTGITKPSLLLEILTRIEARDIRYAVLTPASEQVPDTSSDIDLALDADPRKTIEPILLEMQGLGEIKILQRLYYEVPTGFCYILLSCQQQNPDLLFLDCLLDPYGISRYNVNTQEVVAGRVKERWGYRASDADLALYFLRKRASKAAQFRLTIDQDELDDLQQILRRLQIPDFDRIAGSFQGDNAEEIIKSIGTAKTVKEANSAIMHVWQIWGRHRWIRHPVQWLHSMWRNVFRLAHRLLHPTGLFVVLLGPDGCGKSTVAHAITHKLPGIYRRSWSFHWRPGFLPKLSKSVQRSTPAITEPQREAVYGTVISLARYLYYLTDFTLGYWFLVYPRKVATTLVVGERWYYDVIVNPQRYGFRLPPWILQLGQRFVPRPDIVFLLKASPVEVHRRKPELTTEEIKTQISKFRALLVGEPTVEVDTGTEAFNSIQRVQFEILEKAARVTGRRLEHALEWRGFALRSGVKVWRHRKESARKALQLYHPASTIGRLAKFVASTLPTPLSNSLFFHTLPSLAEIARLCQHTKVIRLVLSEPTATVSFATGTPGPHRKTVAQAALAGTVRAYVKMDVNNTLAMLFDTESAALTSMKKCRTTPFRHPELLFDTTVQDVRYLFLSSPGNGTRSRPLKPDLLDKLFLTYWMDVKAAQIPLENILANIPTPSSVNGNEAQVLFSAMDFVRTSFMGSAVRVWPSHGDYVPWNALLLSDNSLYVFDWEYFDAQAPALQDFFHRIFMPARLVESLSPRQAVIRLLSLRSDAFWGPILDYSGVCDKELPVYLMLYLLRLVTRQGISEISDDSSPSYVITCMRILLLQANCTNNRMKVLVSAYACEPNKGSEPGIGWNLAKQAARFHEVWVLTRRNNREAIEEEMRRNPDSSLHFSYVDLPVWFSFWKRGAKGLHIYYCLWQIAAYRHAKMLHGKIDFDIAHHLTFGNVWLPTLLWKLPIPFIWGPLGGYETIPLPFWRPFKLKWKLLEFVRCLIRLWARHLDPVAIKTGKKASVIIGRTFETTSILSHNFPHKIRTMPGNGLNRSDMDNLVLTRGDSDEASFLNVLMAGRMIHWKGFDMGIQAFQKLVSVNKNAKLHIIGSGPEEKYLRSLCTSIDIGDKVIFHGQTTHQQALGHFENADVLLHPSLKDSACSVIFEAMAVGIPVVCLDSGGPGEVITESCGIKIHLKNPCQAVEELAEALILLSKDKTLRRKLGKGGRERLEEFFWEKQGDVQRELYMEAISAETVKHGKNSTQIR